MMGLFAENMIPRTGAAETERSSTLGACHASPLCVPPTMTCMVQFTIWRLGFPLPTLLHFTTAILCITKKVWSNLEDCAYFMHST